MPLNVFDKLFDSFVETNFKTNSLNMYMYLRVLTELNQKLIPSFRGSYWQSYTLLLYLFCTLLFIYQFIYIYLYNFEFIYFFIIYLFIYLLYSYVYVFIFFFINYLQLSCLYCYHPVLIITCILNQIVYIKPCL